MLSGSSSKAAARPLRHSQLIEQVLRDCTGLGNLVRWRIRPGPLLRNLTVSEGRPKRALCHSRSRSGETRISWHRVQAPSVSLAPQTRSARPRSLREHPAPSLRRRMIMRASWGSFEFQRNAVHRVPGAVPGLRQTLHKVSSLPLLLVTV